MKPEIRGAKYFAVMCFGLSLLAFAPLSNARQTLNSTQIGYARLLANAGTTVPAGAAIFGVQANGVLVSEAGVPFAPQVQSGRIYVEVSSSTDTGIALANPASQSASITYYLTDNTGSNYASGSFTVGAKQQFSAFLSKAPFLVKSGTAATMTFTSSRPVSAMALRTTINERKETLLSTIPVVPVGSTSGGTSLLIPNAGNKSGMFLQILLINPGDTTITGTVSFFGAGTTADTVQPAKVLMYGTTSSTFSYSIPPRSFYQAQPQVPTSGIAIQSMHVAPGLNQKQPATFGILYYHPGTVTVSTAGLTAPASATAVRTYLETTGTFGQKGSTETMVTIENPSSSTLQVGMHVMKLDGTFANLSGTFNIPPKGQIIKRAKDLFPTLPAGFRGSIRITAPSSMVVTAVRNRYNERVELLTASTQPYNEATSPSQEVDFPEFVRGGGYNTQLILLSTGNAQSGAIWVMDKNGTVLPSSTVKAGP
jgi:hypothetical protein